MQPPTLGPALFDFLRELQANNERPWFEANKARYIADVRDPMLDFIAAFAEPLAKISPHFVADPRANGGSLFRIYRDTRFSPDKTPLQDQRRGPFPPRRGKDAHTPGFYLHLAPEACFAGCGIWSPGGAALAQIRNAIADNSGGWKRLTQAKAFRETFDIMGQSLKRPPRGFDATHPLIEDLKRKGLRRPHAVRRSRCRPARLSPALCADRQRRRGVRRIPFPRRRRTVLGGAGESRLNADTPPARRRSRPAAAPRTAYRRTQRGS